MTRHTLRLDPDTGVAYCTECGAEFRPPLDPGVLCREECRKDAPSSEFLGSGEIEITAWNDTEARYVRS